MAFFPIPIIKLAAHLAKIITLPTQKQQKRHHKRPPHPHHLRFYRRQLRPRLRAHHRRARKTIFWATVFCSFPPSSGLYLFSMGIGAHLTQYIKDKDVLHRFIEKSNFWSASSAAISALALFSLRFIRSPVHAPLLYAFLLIVPHGCRHGNSFSHARVRSQRCGI